MKIKIFDKWWKKLIISGFFCFAALIIITFISHSAISGYSEKYIYSDLSKIPKNKVGLILGTAKNLGRFINPFFKYRIEAAVKLFRAGKIEYILISGDNSIKSYNEPLDMKNELMIRGIPENRIFLDYAGFRTYDSIIRCREIFGQSSITVISQRFHNERAVYIARKKGIKAIAYNARDVEGRTAMRVNFREYFARVNVLLDIFVLNKQPKFLGDKILIR